MTWPVPVRVQSLSQFPLSLANRYIVNFDMAANPDDNSHGYFEKALSLNATGGATRIYTFNDPSATYNDLGWTKMSYEFTATSISTVLTFADIRSNR